MALVKPFLQWVGEKTPTLSAVHDFPKQIHNYHEPFLGDGSVLLALLSDKSITVSGRIYASDNNPHLIALYKNIKYHPEKLIDEVRKITDAYAKCSGSVVNQDPSTIEEALTSQESYYFWIRSHFNLITKDAVHMTILASIQASAMLLFLNKTCVRGLYCEGPRGFNVPFGNYENVTIIDEAHICEVSALIHDVIFTCESYVNALVRVSGNPEGDFVYLAPPSGFSQEDHKILFSIYDTIEARKLMRSDSDVVQ